MPSQRIQHKHKRVEFNTLFIKKGKPRKSFHNIRYQLRFSVELTMYIRSVVFKESEIMFQDAAIQDPQKGGFISNASGFSLHQQRKNKNNNNITLRYFTSRKAYRATKPMVYDMNLREKQNLWSIFLLEPKGISPLIVTLNDHMHYTFLICCYHYEMIWVAIAILKETFINHLQLDSVSHVFACTIFSTIFLPFMVIYDKEGEYLAGQ
ncbi:hypothetical protein ACJX0J_017625 [Zea mays]